MVPTRGLFERPDWSAEGDSDLAGGRPIHQAYRQPIEHFDEDGGVSQSEHHQETRCPHDLRPDQVRPCAGNHHPLRAEFWCGEWIKLSCTLSESTSVLPQS